MQKASPAISIRAESGLEPELMQGLIEGRIDIGVMYTPQSRPGLKVEQLFDERLVMVSTSTKNAPEPQAGYVYVDWGPEFYARHSACFPNFGSPSLTANIGWLGLQHLMKNGGSGYFPMRTVLPHVAAKRLHIVPRAPEFSVPAYVVYPVDSERDVIASAIEIMHQLAGSAAKNKAAAKPVKRIKR
jgi:DNA-binding transcriptional LysR family regulator